MKTNVNSIIVLLAMLILQMPLVFSQQPCTELYEDMRNRYDIQTEHQFKSYFHEMLSLDEEQLRKNAAVNKSDFSISGAFDAITGFMSNGKYNSSSMELVIRLKHKYERENALSDSDYKRFIIDVLDEEIAQKANECIQISYSGEYALKELENDAIKASFEYQLAMKKLELDQEEYDTYKNNGFVISYTGNLETEFVLKIRYYPSNYNPIPVEINSATISTALKKIGKDRLFDGVKLYPGEEIQQHFVRTNNDEGFITVSVKSIPTNLELKFPSRGGTAFPIGTIVASTLTFSQFSNETNNNPTGIFDSRYSKWAPADGRDVKGSYYHNTYSPYLPDLRGQFIRGVNVMDLTRQDDYKNSLDVNERKIINGYSYQNDFIKTHNHKINLSSTTSKHKGHVHKVSDSHVGGNGDKFPWGGGAERTTKVRQTSKSGAHTHNVRINGNSDNNSNGGNETTVKNVSVYYYIRINR